LFYLKIRYSRSVGRKLELKKEQVRKRERSVIPESVGRKVELKKEQVRKRGLPPLLRLFPQQDPLSRIVGRKVRTEERTSQEEGLAPAA
jgi:hypothetical protein